MGAAEPSHKQNCLPVAGDCPTINTPLCLRSVTEQCPHHVVDTPRFSLRSRTLRRRPRLPFPSNSLATSSSSSAAGYLVLPLPLGVFEFRTLRPSSPQPLRLLAVRVFVTTLVDAVRLCRTSVPWTAHLLDRRLPLHSSGHLGLLYRISLSPFIMITIQSPNHAA
jgi:hypothetical protein